MSQTKEGALKVSAAHAGLTVDEFKSLIESGQKRCTKCKQWRSRSLFGSDKSRDDGLAAACGECRRVKQRKSTKGRVSTFLGKKHSDAAKERMALAKVGKPSGRLGKRHSIETRAKISVVTRERTPRGEACHTFVDGKSGERHGERNTAEYKQWRYDVYLRDRFTCQHCGDARGGNLNAHHIKAFAAFPELRIVISNGITLCDTCHDAFHGGDETVAKTIESKSLLA